MSKKTPTVKGFSKIICGTDGWIAPPSGPTSGSSVEWHGVGPWIASLRGFLAPPSPQPVSGSVPQIPAISGPKYGESLARLDPVSCGWKMFTDWLSGMEGSRHTLGPSLLTLPPWGMTVGGALYRLKTPALPTVETDGGAWPTPTVGEAPNKRANIKKWNGLNTVTSMAEAGMWMTPTSALEGTKTQLDGSYKPGLKTQAKMWATSRAHDAKMSPGELNRHDGLNKMAFLFGRQAPRTPLPGSESYESSQGLPPPSEGN